MCNAFGFANATHASNCRNRNCLCLLQLLMYGFECVFSSDKLGDAATGKIFRRI
jgi:hypothetical protein